MAIKLLPKSEINRLKGVEKKIEIDEGMKLAKRIDGLREVMAETESSFEKFRVTRLSQIHEEITQELQKNEQLKQENKSLEETRARLKVPLDKEWERVNEESSSLQQFLSRVVEREQNVDKREEDVSNSEKECSEILTQAKNKNSVADRYIADAVYAKESATLLLEKAQKIETAALDLEKNVNVDLVHRTEIVSKREEDVTIRETDALSSQKEIEESWKLLKDRMATFERTLKRKF